MPDWACRKCGAINLDAQADCEGCGRARSAAHEPQMRTFCPYDGGHLGDFGMCEKGKGFPLGTMCPFSCPLCRHPLEWDGRCEQCHGSYTTGDRAQWTFPGDRYDLYDDQGQPIGDGRHWVKTDGPRKACTPDENKVAALHIRRILARGALKSEKPSRGRQE